MKTFVIDANIRCTDLGSFPSFFILFFSFFSKVNSSFKQDVKKIGKPFSNQEQISPKR